MTKILVEHEINCSGNLCGHCERCGLKYVNLKTGQQMHYCYFFEKRLSKKGEKIDIRASEFKNYQRLPECVKTEVAYAN